MDSTAPQTIQKQHHCGLLWGKGNGLCACAQGSKAGMPSTPILFMLYATKIEHTFLTSGLGFTLCFTAAGLPETWTLPGLVFADDMVLLAEDVTSLQGLVTVPATQLGELGLCCNAKKSAVLRFSGPDDDARITLPVAT